MPDMDAWVPSGGGYNPLTGATYTYTYDSMRRSNDLTWTANYVVKLLNSNMAVLAATHPNLTADQLLQATAASYNFGTGNIRAIQIRSMSARLTTITEAMSDS